MSANKHDIEGEGAKPRDHMRLRHHIWHHVHQHWGVWLAVMLMLALVMVYVMTDSLSLRPGRLAHQPTPAANGP